MTTLSSIIAPAGIIGATGPQGPQGTGITYTIKSADYTLVADDGILADTSTGLFTLYLPASPELGTQVFIADAKNTWSTNNLTINRNGSTIKDQSQDMLCDISNISIQFVYNGSTWGVFIQAGITGSTATSTAVAVEGLSPFLFL